MLKELPALGRFHHEKNLYAAKAIIGENGGNDEWPVNVKIWHAPHEQTWSFRHWCKRELHAPKIGKVYDAVEGSESGFSSAAEAYSALEAALSKAYA